ncbi:hypothetical protein [Sulfitobacter sabulilitoris]|uniref:RepB-like DNA primase domain-containing protein n=1 Tax=Sulfitobacter sabulilitoris TaxID=2562655 RepID=A0A5S3PLB6_9RHOB|nr:hypothetical protein [Sulfitobacter sabulilitoris]TMM55121.1 hypothetical protein FDT80_06015 [Sulfitobacter sabulilitoris]
MQHVSLDEFVPADNISSLTAEEYCDFLHPKGGRGRAAVFIKFDNDRVETRSLERETLLAHMPSFLDQTSYLTLNRFWFGRRGKFLAAFNALYVDLDYFNSPQWRGKTPDEVQAAYAAKLLSSNVPQPSIISQSGRGLAAIWLIREIPVAARPRWQAAMKALIEISASFGVDKSCKDSSRVFRIPGTINEKVGKEVRVSGGTGLRHSFDWLADQIFSSVGKPRRTLFEQRKRTRRGLKTAPQKVPEGLTQSRRFKLILEDLETVRIAHGGRIQEGSRNTWLHLYATCLTHLHDVGNIEREVEAMASIATPGLEPSEVTAVAHQAIEKTKHPASAGAPGSEGRYYYSGATIAEKLDVPAEMARDLNLKQIMPEEEKKRRNAARERQRRAEKGAVSREEFLSKNNATRTEPWRALSISRSKYYAQKKAGLLDNMGSRRPWTGPCPLQGRSQIRGPEEERRTGSDTPPLCPDREQKGEEAGTGKRGGASGKQAVASDKIIEGSRISGMQVGPQDVKRPSDDVESSFLDGAMQAGFLAALLAKAAGNQAHIDRNPIGSLMASPTATEKGEDADLVTHGIPPWAPNGEHHVRYSKDDHRTAPLCRSPSRSPPECSISAVWAQGAADSPETA